MTEGSEDDPHDESTHWIGQIRKESTNSNERDTRRTKQSNVQRKKPPVEKRKKT